MNIGAAWVKETSDGKKYFSCQIQVPGMTLNFAIFKNEKKEKDNQPDYNIIWSPQKKDKTKGESGGAFANDEEDVPF